MRPGVARDEVELQLVKAGTPGAPPGRSVVYCHVRGVVSYHAASVERGAAIAKTLAERVFGRKDFWVRDLDGNLVGFGDPVDSGDADISTDVVA